ncbi:unnamed protein product [Gordionus sp. m RMFG-2023]
MGVPAFFRWLSRKYPSIVVSCVEDKNIEDPKDLLNSNPNNIEFDNVYLDMNGIIHPCCHPEYKAAPETEEDMMVDIYAYIDRLFGLLRPRKVLYMAVDGVAPRAKMNQQRSRRFRGAQESSEKSSCMEKVKRELIAKGIAIPDEKNKTSFDSNCITPGTPFMHRLSLCLRYYIQDRLTHHPAWKNLKVILSDANVPGEGEHKIMDFIRKQRANPDHDPNTKHCLCGADADLIMLGLATHEPHFTIIREEFKPHQERPCDMCGKKGHELKDCTGQALLPSLASANDIWNSSNDSTEDEALENSLSDGSVSFLFIRIDLLRQYLERELLYDSPRGGNSNFEGNNGNTPQRWRNNNNETNGNSEVSLQRPKRLDFDLERVIDDWVFLCFFVGNDFLPHLPSLEIRENAIDRLVRIYKEMLSGMDGYLTCNGLVNLKSVQVMLTKLGEVEDGIFKTRQDNEKRFRQREAERSEREQRIAQANTNVDGVYHPLGKQGFNSVNSNNAIKFISSGTLKDIKPSAANNRRGFGALASSDKTADPDKNVDDVRLWEDGFKDRYYAMKFKADSNDMKFRNEVAVAYAKGLCWVLLYYYQGCPCWNWFFPFHYAPFASDFQGISKKITNVFEVKTFPFKPLEQLMAVFPAASGMHIPTPWAELMEAPDSPILDFYPIHFKVDLNGKKFAWQGVALLPFVDEKRLLETLHEKVYDKLTDFEKNLNSQSFDRIYISAEHPAYSVIKSIIASDNKLDRGFVTLEASFCQGMAGLVKLDTQIVNEGEIPSPISSLPPIKNTLCVGVFYKDPQYSDDYVFQAKLLPNVEMPIDALRPMNWDEKTQGRYRPPLGFGNNITSLFPSPGSQVGPTGRRLMNQALDSATRHNSNLSRYGDASETRRQRNNSSSFNNPSDAYNSNQPYNNNYNPNRDVNSHGGRGNSIRFNQQSFDYSKTNSFQGYNNNNWQQERYTQSSRLRGDDFNWQQQMLAHNNANNINRALPNQNFQSYNNGFDYRHSDNDNNRQSHNYRNNSDGNPNRQSHNYSSNPGGNPRQGYIHNNGDPNRQNPSNQFNPRNNSNSNQPRMRGRNSKLFDITTKH